ncbi:MAG: hypothetical protein LW696_07295 [Alphaproteobacteria bacterium]|jgi:hypothetical protein|nr:hypothetical protein [Alphaproteobacteria bacterium]
MNAYTVELTIDEITELHVTLVLRREQLIQEQSSNNKTIQAIATRQLERISPMLEYFNSIVIEHYQTVTESK